MPAMVTVLAELDLVHLIVDAIRTILRKGTDHQALCHEAHTLTTEDPHRSRILASKFSTDYDLYRARHYIGRLSSWHTAADNVASLGMRFRSVLDDCEISVVEKSRTEKITTRVLEGGLESAFGRVLPNYRGHPLIAAAVAKLDVAAKALPMEMETRPHAEVIVLDHFHVHGLTFAMEDCYIACSKPSCYCCKLYLDIHPLFARTGRYHGNLWMKWAVPRPLEMPDGATDRVALRLMRRMSDLVRDDLLSTLLVGRSSVVQPFDSTTGIS